LTTPQYRGQKRPLKNAPFWPISASGSNFNPRNIKYIPVVEIFAFLDLDQISADFEIEHFSKVSYRESGKALCQKNISNIKGGQICFCLAGSIF